ncbi:MAG TPA: ribonuclease III [Bacilli bacterium]|nr:ribonuclease III [Bacilli bacterium]
MKELLEKLGIKYKNIEYYEQAFRHTSYCYEASIKTSYERLEFLGDAILDLAVSDYLYKSEHYEEGVMTRIRASYVCENAVAIYADSLNFSNYIKVGHGEEQSGGRYKKAILADVFEAFLAAIYLDLGFETSKEFALKIAVPYIKDDSILLFKDYKSVLQEAVQTDRKSLVYELVDENGPAHNKTFTVVVKVDDIVYGKGVASSKKDAEQMAAQEALAKIAK